LITRAIEQLKPFNSLEILDLGFANLPNINIVGSYANRELPIFIKRLGVTQLTKKNVTDGYIYGIGYYNDFNKAPKNRLIIERVMCVRGVLDAKATDIYGNSFVGKNKIV